MTRLVKTVSVLGVLLASMAGCDDHGHDHGDGHGHEHGDHGHGDHGHGDEEGPEPIAITKWTEGHELFVELDPPQPKKTVGYHAHITILDGFEPATKGTFTVRYMRGDEMAAEARVDELLRAGIFAPEAPAPPAGTYDLQMIFEDGDERAIFECGTIAVAEGPAAATSEDAAELSFLKEQQWKIPFATAWAEKRAMAREIELPAVVESPGSDRLTIASPTGGRFFHRAKVALAEGVELKKGTVVGHIAPTVAGEDFSRLQLAVDEARLAKERAQRERKRIAPLVEDGLLPQKRLIAVQAEIDAASAKLKSARRRVGEVVSPGGRGGIPIKATSSGTVAQVLAQNGAPVAPGEPLVRLVGSEALWVKARFVARPERELTDARPVGLRISGHRLELGAGSRFLSLLPIVDQDTQLASWTARLGAMRAPSDAVTIKPGINGVLLVRVGAPKDRIAVPVEAVIEIDTRPFVFVQTGGESFHKRRVTLGVRDGGFVEVLQGVSAGERVVTRGGFDIHLAAVMGTVASHRH